jgi:probable HAF family extracellular repeat protein
MWTFHQRVWQVVTVLLLVGLLPSRARADALYTAADLGLANPSANYLNALTSSQQATFQAGSFDVYSHPAAVNGSAYTFYFPSGDIVPYLGGPPMIDQVSFPSLVTSNNNGDTIGTGQLVQGSGTNNQLVLLDYSPHQVETPWTPQDPNHFITSPGYLYILGIPWSGSASQPPVFGGINDHLSVALTEYAFSTAGTPLSPGGYPQVSVPHLIIGNDSPNRTPLDLNLGTLGGANGVANALNNSNQVVGWSQIASGAQHAFLYSNGVMQDLNSLTALPTGFTLTSAVGIDADGDIVAYATDSSGQTHEVMLTPIPQAVPEPSMLAVLVVMVAGFVTHKAFRARKIA